MVQTSRLSRPVHEEHEPDEELVARYRSGEAPAADTILKRYRGFARMKASSYFLRGADRDDLVQEGLIGLYKAIRDFDMDRGIPFRAFADVCVTRQMLSAIKSASRNKHGPLNSYVSISSGGSEEDWDATLEEATPVVADPAELVVGQQDIQAIHTAFGDLLTVLEADVLHLYLEGTSYRDIALQLGCSVKAVDNAVQRIRRKVGVHLRTRANDFGPNEARVINLDFSAGRRDAG